MMPQRASSRASIMILTSIGRDDDKEFHLCCGREHLRERVSIPGFSSSWRYTAKGPARCAYLAAGASAEMFETPRRPVHWGPGNARSTSRIGILCHQPCWDGPA